MIGLVSQQHFNFMVSEHLHVVEDAGGAALAHAPWFPPVHWLYTAILYSSYVLVFLLLSVHKLFPFPFYLIRPLPHWMLDTGMNYGSKNQY